MTRIATMMMGQRFALPLLAVLAASPAAAQDSIPATRWKTVLTGDDGTTVSIDSATIDRGGDSIFGILTTVRFAAPATLATGETVDREIDSEELDCGSGRTRGSYSELWMGERRLRRTPLPSAWASVTPGRRAAFDASCAWLLGGFAAQLPRTYDVREVEQAPELTNRAIVSGLMNREFPTALRNLGLNGAVTLRMRVLADGTVQRSSVEVIESNHPDFSEAARRVVYRMRFRPARIRGRGVAVWVTLPLTFRNVSGPESFPPGPPP